MGKAGRPAGSKTRPQLRDFIDEKERKALIKKAKTMATNGDSGMMKWILDQIFGKAVQPLGNEEGKEFKILFDNAFNKK